MEYFTNHLCLLRIQMSLWARVYNEKAVVILVIFHGMPQIKELCMIILYHGIAKTVVNTINGAYAQGTMARMGVILL